MRQPIVTCFKLLQFAGRRSSDARFVVQRLVEIEPSKTGAHYLLDFSKALQAAAYWRGMATFTDGLQKARWMNLRDTGHFDLALLGLHFFRLNRPVESRVVCLRAR